MDSLRDFDLDTEETFDLPADWAGPNGLAGAPAPPPVFLSEAAAPDVPAEVGGMILASFAAIMGSYYVFFANGRLATMLIVIGLFLALVYFGIPTIFLRMEPKRRRASYADFLERGMDTWTGHVSARDALAGILTIPLAIALAVFVIGIIVHLTI